MNAFEVKTRSYLSLDPNDIMEIQFLIFIEFLQYAMHKVVGV